VDGGRTIDTNAMCPGESIGGLSQLLESPWVIVDDAKLRCFCRLAYCRRRSQSSSRDLASEPVPTLNYGDPKSKHAKPLEGVWRRRDKANRKGNSINNPATILPHRFLPFSTSPSLCFSFTRTLHKKPSTALLTTQTAPCPEMGICRGHDATTQR
jgi:hypothetical protein